MKKDNFNDFFALLFLRATNQLIAKKYFSNGIDLIRILNMSYDQYKNIRSGRTPISPIEWRHFIHEVKKLDPDYIYRWVIDEIKRMTIAEGQGV